MAEASGLWRPPKIRSSAVPPIAPSESGTWPLGDVRTYSLDTQAPSVALLSSSLNGSRLKVKVVLFLERNGPSDLRL